MQMQRMGSLFILCINTDVLTDTELKSDANANVDYDIKCEWTLSFVYT